MEQSGYALVQRPARRPHAEVQYVIKDIILVAAGMVIAAGAFPLSARGPPGDGEIYENDGRQHRDSAAAGWLGCDDHAPGVP